MLTAGHASLVPTAGAGRATLADRGDKSAEQPFLVPKHRVQAEVLLKGHPARTVWLYLCDCSESHWGRERPSDLLNNANGFIPVTDDDGSVVLLQKDAVMLLSIPAGHEAGAGCPEEVEQAGLTITQNLELQLVDGTSLEGSVTYLGPDGSQRLQDYLNSAEKYISVRSGSTVHHVARQSIASISPVANVDRHPRRRAEDA